MKLVKRSRYLVTNTIKESSWVLPDTPVQFRLIQILAIRRLIAARWERSPTRRYVFIWSENNSATSFHFTTDRVFSLISTTLTRDRLKTPTQGRNLFCYEPRLAPIYSPCVLYDTDTVLLPQVIPALSLTLPPNIGPNRFGHLIRSIFSLMDFTD